MAGPADVPALAALMAAAPLLQRYRVTNDSASEALSAAIANKDVVLVSRESEESSIPSHIDPFGQGSAPVGLAWVTFAPRLLNGAAYLRLLLVTSPGHGVGSRLLEVAEGVARQRANHLYLLTTTDNAQAKRFYERHAYRYVGDLPGLVHPDLDESLYQKALRPYTERLSG